MPYKLVKSGSGYFVEDDKGKKYSGKPMSRSRAVRQMRALYASEATKEQSFTVLKQSDGAYRWVLFSSTAYRDRDGEIVSMKALQDDCDRADASGNYGPLRWWHVPGVDIGDCDFNMLYGKTLIESGTFKSAFVAERVKENAGRLQVSIGFRHPRGEPDASGVFHRITRFERSLLPVGRASNPFTTLLVTKENFDMATVQEKIKAFGALLRDDDLVKTILATAQTAEKSADERGVEFKEAETPADETTEKAKAKPAQVEIEIGSEGEDETSPEDETEDDEEMMNKEADLFVGDLSPSEFGELIAAVVIRANQPMTQALKELQDENVRVKESRASLETQVKELADKVSALTGNLPKAAKSYLASQAPETVLEDGHRLKQSSPHADPTEAIFRLAMGIKE